MVYNYNNLQIFDCSIYNVNCELIQGNFEHNPNTLRGGSSIVKFMNTEYFVSFGFTHLDSKSPKCHIYRPSLTVFKAGLNDFKPFEHIFTSDPIDFENILFV